ncbi:MAG: 16S rRNA (uracil(1498)-N(3))-methyltransferase [Candidatus Izemoplasmatales bacterium]|jgi:16S rRNA (uracil1498-N3)-methyltransferase|nr:16S rRNA (uracil(1498)-N(3))-methyltransferase [Candidatus Izemoplasmatales bacterium]
MQRYFIKEAHLTDDHILIKGNDFHHMKHVMRMIPGDRVILNDRSGIAYLAVLEGFAQDTARLKRLEQLPQKPRLNVTIAQALIKRDGMELMIAKATEFGALAIIPTAFTRSIVKIEDEDTAAKKTLRYQTIAKEAAEQCQRNHVPIIYGPTKLKDLPFADFDRIWVAYEAAKSEDTLNHAIANANPNDNILLIIGPEGGIEAAEIAFLKTKNAEIIDLGIRILRSETAALYLLSVLSYLWGR